MLRSKSSALSSLILAAVLAAPMSAQQGALTFMDVQRINRGGSWAPSPDGALMLPTWCTGDVSFDLIPIHAPGGVDFGWVFAGLKAVGYDGAVTVHQSAQPGETPEESASGTADFLRGLI